MFIALYGGLKVQGGVIKAEPKVFFSGVHCLPHTWSVLSGTTVSHCIVFTCLLYVAWQGAGCQRVAR